MVIEGERVLLRPVQPQDFPRIVQWTLDPEVNRFIHGDYPDRLEDCPRWFAQCRSNRYKQLFAIVTREGELIGDIELDNITWRSGDAELRVRIGEKAYWDRGFGTDAVKTLLAHAFDRMGLKRVYLRVYTFNRRAIRCYEKAGFRKEGRLRRRNGEDQEILLMRVLAEEFRARAARQLVDAG